MTYSYNKMFQTLQQLDEHGRIVCSMQMPVEDLQKISFLSWVEDVEKFQETLAQEQKM